MIKYSKLLVLVISLFNTYDGAVFAQEKSDLTPEIIIDEFIRKIGGEKWHSLKSRKEYAFVEYEEDKNSIVPANSYDRIKINLNPGMSIEVHKGLTSPKSILVYKPDCNWYYSGVSQMVKFFGPEPIKFRTTFPRTELMEVLNLELMKKVYIEDTLYRVDFTDIRQLDGKQSLFFGMNSGLLYKEVIRAKTMFIGSFTSVITQNYKVFLNPIWLS